MVYRKGKEREENGRQSVTENEENVAYLWCRTALMLTPALADLASVCALAKREVQRV